MRAGLDGPEQVPARAGDIPVAFLALAQRTTGELLSQQAVRYSKRFSKYFG